VRSRATWRNKERQGEIEEQSRAWSRSPLWALLSWAEINPIQEINMFGSDCIMLSMFSGTLHDYLLTHSIACLVFTGWYHWPWCSKWLDDDIANSVLLLTSDSGVWVFVYTLWPWRPIWKTNSDCEFVFPTNLSGISFCDLQCVHWLSPLAALS
jgi:hypothetical protein